MTGVAYDDHLSDEIRGELGRLGGSPGELRTALERLLGRLEPTGGASASEAARLSRTLEFLRSREAGPADAPPAAPTPPEPLRRSLEEVATLSGRLDSFQSPSEGFAFAEGVARRAHELAGAVEGALAHLDPHEALSGWFERFLSLLSRLIRNAVAKIQAFAHLLGVTAFSLAFTSDPPGVTATFSFGGG